MFVFIFLFFFLVISVLRSSVECYTRVTTKFEPDGDGSIISLSAGVSPTKNSACNNGCPGGCNLAYNGYNVMRGTVNLYHIFVGKSATDYTSTGSANNFVDILATFAQGYGGSGHANILSTFKDNYGTAATSFKFVGNAFHTLPSSQDSLTDSDISTIIQSATASKGWSFPDSNGIYSVFFRGDLTYASSINNNEAWGTKWCGFHSDSFPNLNGAQVSIVGDTSFKTSLQGGCAGQFSDCATNGYYIPNPQSPFCRTGYTCSALPDCYLLPPNGNIGADAAVKVYDHEIMEIVSDGNGAYYVTDPNAQCRGYENGDLCSQSYSDVQYTAGVGHWNAQFSNGGKFLLQDGWQWSNTGGQCISSYASTTTTPPTSVPLVSPSANPTPAPITTFNPTSPTKAPTVLPTSPTRNPTTQPSSLRPTFIPSSPTSVPSLQPSIPTIVPTSVPTSAPSKAPSSSSSLSIGGCFPGSQMVEMSDNTMRRIDAILVGEMVKTVDAIGRAVTAPVVAIPHPLNHLLTKFIRLETADGGSVTLTPSHLILAFKVPFLTSELLCSDIALSSFVLVAAQVLSPGDCLLSSQSGSGLPITSGTIVWDKGIYTIVTQEAYVAVNGFVASPFAVTHSVPHAFYNAHRLFFKLAPDTFIAWSGLNTIVAEMVGEAVNSVLGYFFRLQSTVSYTGMA